VTVETAIHFKDKPSCQQQRDNILSHPGKKKEAERNNLSASFC
jgi:hypothetical protein